MGQGEWSNYGISLGGLGLFLNGSGGSFDHSET